MPKRERQQRSFLLGLGLLTALAALAGLIFFLDDLLHGARGRTTLIAIMTEARNVRRGAPVWIAGKPVGEVTAVEIMPRGRDTTARVALRLEIERRYMSQLNTGSRVRLTSDRLIGEPALDILPGAPGSAPLSALDTLYTRRLVSISVLRARAAALNVAIDSLNAASARITRVAAGRRAGAAVMQRALEGLQREFGALTVQLADPAGLRALEDPRLRASMDRLGLTTRELAQAFTALNAGSRSRPADVSAAFAALQQRARSLAQDMAALQALMNQSGTLARLQTDSAIWRAFQGVRASLDSLVVEAGRNPGRFVF